MLNNWYYIGISATYIFIVLPFAGILTLLFPAFALHFRNKFRILFIFLLSIAVYSQFTIFGAVWSMGVKYTGQTGAIKVFTDGWPIVMLILFALNFLLSLYLQSKKLDRTPYQHIYFSLAFFAALTITGPLYFLLVNILDKLLI